jgi:hypothetical protein
MPRTGYPLLDHALEMLADGVPDDAVRRHLDRCIVVERARQEELFALMSTAFELIAGGENEGYVTFTLTGLAGSLPHEPV